MKKRCHCTAVQCLDAALSSRGVAWQAQLTCRAASALGTRKIEPAGAEGPSTRRISMMPGAGSRASDSTGRKAGLAGSAGSGGITPVRWYSSPAACASGKTSCSTADTLARFV